jgi:protein gp37
MGENSAIEWTDCTFNPWWGCTRVSPACDDCYADTWARRLGLALWDNGQYRAFGPAHWAEPFRWNRRAQKDGRRRRVFCASMADVFDKDAPETERQKLWRTIEATPHLDWLLLTKRVGNVMRMVPPHWHERFPQNVWLGISVVTPLEVARDRPKLAAIPAYVRFLSMEPLLEDTPMDGQLDGIHWVIVGGESGRKARPMLQQWAMHIRLDCLSAGVPFFFKQGSAANWPAYKDSSTFPEGLRVREWPRSHVTSEGDHS